MKQTAMQELIEIISDLQDHQKAGSNEWFALAYIKQEAENKLEKEKQQIVDSFHQGQISVCEIIANERKVSIPKDVRSDFEDANNYYNQTYKTK